MKQYEAVILTLENLGGQATLAQLYREVMKIKECRWGTKTPFASIRRIVQTRREIFKVRPGLWALQSHKARLGLLEENEAAALPQQVIDQSHSYYQGLLAVVGNLRGFSTFIPNQDRNKTCVGTPLARLRTLHELPLFTYEALARRAATVDVTWFNARRLPDSLFEVEHSTDILTSLMKFYELQDFHARMVIVAPAARKPEFDHKRHHPALREISQRVAFYDYDSLVRDYEHEVVKSAGDFVL